MRKHKKKSRYIITNIICFTLAFLVGIATSRTVRAAKAIDDWHYYDNYAIALAMYRASDNIQPTEDTDIITGEDFKNHADQYNISDASDAVVALVERAKTLVRANLGGHSSLLWEHFDNLQVKDCDLGVFRNNIPAFYVPEDNTIYLNRAAIYGPEMDQYRYQVIIHELIHALLERDSDILENDTGAFHEGLAEYLSQSIRPTGEPSYYLAYCMAEVFVKDNGLDQAIELVMSGQAEESINQRLGKEDLIRTINGPLYTSSYDPKHQIANEVVLDAYLHYVQITGVDVGNHADIAAKRVEFNYSNLPKILYFRNLRKNTSRDDKTVAAFPWHKKYPSFRSDIF